MIDLVNKGIINHESFKYEQYFYFELMEVL